MPKKEVEKEEKKEGVGSKIVNKIKDNPEETIGKVGKVLTIAGGALTEISSVMKDAKENSEKS